MFFQLSTLSTFVQSFSGMELTPINDVVVEPVPIPLSEDDLRPVLGEELFPELFFNLFICAKK